MKLSVKRKLSSFVSEAISLYNYWRINLSALPFRIRNRWLAFWLPFRFKVRVLFRAIGSSISYPIVTGVEVSYDPKLGSIFITVYADNGMIATVPLDTNGASTIANQLNISIDNLLHHKDTPLK